MVKPVLKWVGGKTQIIDDVLTLFPTNIKNYHEPFLGGGSVLLELLTRVKEGKIKVSGKIFASDVNPNIIHLYTNIQGNPKLFMDEVNVLVHEFASIQGTVVNRHAQNKEEAQTSQESYYFWIRKKFNSLTPEERATPRASAMVVFLNKTCFRGMYREGPNGFNVPFGNYKNPTVVDHENILAVSDIIQGVVFTSQDFEASFKHVRRGDFVYVDPPYAPENDKSFVSYTADGFSSEKHEKLFALCKKVTFLMSNAYVTLVKESFSEPVFKMIVISCRRAIHSKNPESKTNEVLISNY